MWHIRLTIHCLADAGNLARGRVQVGDAGPWCHKVEKLVHLELADLALSAP